MPLCNRKGSLLNLIIRDIEKEESGLAGSLSADVIPPGSPLLARGRIFLPGSSVTRRKGDSLPATASPSLHRRCPSLALGPSNPHVQKRHSLDSKDLDPYDIYRERRTSPVKIRCRRSSKPELYKSKFSFEKDDLAEVKFRLGDDSSDDQRTETDEDADDTFNEETEHDPKDDGDGKVCLLTYHIP